MKRRIFRNLHWKLLALAIAAALWFVVAREPELATSVSVPIEFENIPDHLDIGSNVPERVYVEVRGPAGRLTRDNLAGAAVVLNLSTVNDPGERTFTFQQSNVKMPIGVSFYKAVPSQITLRFDRLSEKTVPIRPRYAGGPPNGYVVEHCTFDPAQVAVVGPESHVAALRFVGTDPIDLRSLRGKSEFDVHLNIGDPQVRLKSVNRVHARIDLKKKDMN